MYSLSRLNNDEATSSTLTYFSGKARLGGCTMNYGRFPSGFPTQIPWTRWTLFSVRFLFLSFSFLRFSFFLPLLMCGLCMPLNTDAVITSLLMFWCFLVNLASTHLSYFTFKQYVVDIFFRLALKQAHWTERVWNCVPSNLSIWHLIFPLFLCALW